MLKLEKFYIYFKFNSINSVEGCMTLDQAWSKVGTLPELPVELGTNLTGDARLEFLRLK